MVFNAIGPRVKYWITFNDPWCSSILGYSTGLFAPGKTSDRARCDEGDSGTEPWIVGHSLLVADGTAVKAYRDDFEQKDGGQIGITLNADRAEPWDANEEADVEACDQKIELPFLGLGIRFALASTPDSMRKQLGKRLSEFTTEEAAFVIGSNDLYGMNRYCANYIKHKDGEAELDDFVGNLEILMENKAGHSIGPETQFVWFEAASHRIQETHEVAQ